MTTLGVILFIICFSGTMVSITKQKFGRCLPVSLLSMPLILYFTQFIFKTFSVGYIIILVFAAAFFLLLVINRKNTDLLRENMFSNGFWCFIALAVMFCILDCNRSFSEWDELSHWGMMTKEMLRLDTWYSEPASRLLVHKEYPPFVSLFEMMWCKLAGGYSEPRVYTALHIFVLSMITPIVAENCGAVSGGRSQTQTTPKAKNKSQYLRRFLYMLILNAVFLIIIMVFDASGEFFTIYKDIALALIFTYGMYLIAHKDALRECFGFVSLVIASTSLLLTKQLGMAFILVIWIYYSVSFMVERKSDIETERKNCTIGNYVLHMALLVSVPAATLGLWKAYIKSREIYGQFDLGRIGVRTYLRIFDDKYCDSLRRQTFNAFCHALFEKDITTMFIPVTYVAAFTVIIIAVMAIHHFYPDQFTIGSAKAMGITYTCGTLGVAFTMSVLYLFCFSDDEMQNLASFERYMSSYVLCEGMVLFCILMEIVSKKRKITLSNMFIFFVMLTAVTGSQNFKAFVPGCLDGTHFHEWQEIADKLEDNIDGEQSYYILASDPAQAGYYTNYYADDLTTSIQYTDVIDGDLTDANMKEEAKQAVFGSDWLYIKDVNDSFNTAFKAFNGGQDYERGMLYKVNKDGDNISVSKSKAMGFEDSMSKYVTDICSGDYTAFITLHGDASKLTDADENSLKQMGCKVDLRSEQGKSYYAIYTGGKICAEELSENTLDKSDRLAGKHSYYIMSKGTTAGGGSSVMIDNSEYAVNTSGLNFVVFDNMKDRVVDSVAFDLSDGGTATRR